MTSQRHSCRARPYAVARALALTTALVALTQIAACTPYYTRRAYAYRPPPLTHEGQRYVHAPHAYGSGYYYDPYAIDHHGDAPGERGDSGHLVHPAAHGAVPDDAHAPRARARP
jgi:hypothetical protein